MLKIFLLMAVVSGCGSAVAPPEDMAPPRDLTTGPDLTPAPDLEPAPADMTWVPPAGAHFAGAECTVTADCDGVAPAGRYCGTDIYDPQKRGFCLDATDEGGGSYHISWGVLDLPAQAGYSFCDMRSLPTDGRFFPGVFLCGTFVVR
jgi:hypothetical protein